MGMRPEMMMTTQSKKSSKPDNVLRTESVDNWHGSWKKVLAYVEKHGGKKFLRIDGDGWLSSRQVLMVAFAGETPIGFIAFTVSPTENGCVEAALDGFHLDRRLPARGIEVKLHQATVKRTKALGCIKLTNWALPTAYYPPRQSWAMFTLH
jgi:hypothetical protein